MKTRKFIFQLLALAFILSLASVTFAQDSSTRKRRTQFNSRSFAEGQELKISGIVIKRDSDSFTLREGLFRADKTSGVSYILRGLRLKVEGRGDDEGQLVATKIRFDEDDLRTAQALEARVDPVEDMATSTKTLAEANQQRIEEVEQNAQKL